jgi:predicted phosphohydrolase
MEIQIASDLHIEFKNDNIPDPLDYITPKASILILAGDIGTFYKYDQLLGFLEKLCPLFDTVFYVLGNHEYYMQKDSTPMTIGCITKNKNELESKISNLYILDRSSVRIGNYCIVGCTLWSDAKIEIPKFIVKIYGMDKKNYLSRFQSDTMYIQKMIKYCNENDLKLIVVTHYVPSFDVIPKNYLNYKFESLYCSDLNYMINENDIHTWICGHVHYNFDTLVNGTRILSNQKGKPRDKIQDFSKEFIVKF